MKCTATWLSNTSVAIFCACLNSLVFKLKLEISINVSDLKNRHFVIHSMVYVLKIFLCHTDG